MNSSGNNFMQIGDPQDMDCVVTTTSTGNSTLFIDGNASPTVTSGTFIGNNTSTTIGWTGYPYWDTTPWWVHQYPWPGHITITADGEKKISISLKEATDLKRAAKKDPKLAKILKKFEGVIEIETDGLF